jgi:hypothetical protein
VRSVSVLGKRTRSEIIPNMHRHSESLLNAFSALLRLLWIRPSTLGTHHTDSESILSVSLLSGYIYIYIYMSECVVVS